jgi:heat shock protein HtpX
VVCVTQGLLGVVNRDELAGVIAHELAHIKNRDMLIATLAATMAGAITYLGYLAVFFGGRDDRNPIAGLALLIVGPIAAGMIQMAISRQREFEADRVGAEISGQPLALASALGKLAAHARRVPLDVNPAAAPLAQVNPLAAQGGGVTRLFSTHPPVTERVAKLEAMARGR